MIGRDIHPEEVSRKVPFLNLMLCVGAIPSFLLISITIEKIPTPFATTTISSASFLTCRLSQFTDDLTADSSVSRQSSLQRKRSQARTVLTMPTEKVFRLETEKGDEKNTTTGPNQQEPPTNEKVATSTAVESRCDLPGGNVTSSSPTPAVPQMTDPALSQSVPQPTYCPGGWQTEWDHASQISDTSVSGPSYRESQDALKASSTRLPQPSTTPSNSATASIPTQQYRYSYRLSGSVAPSNLSTVRYASEPEVAVQQSIRVVRNPAYQPRSISMGTDEYKSLQKPAISRPDVALLRNTQRAQRTVQGPRRQPSNFSRPIQKPDTQSEIDGLGPQESFYEHFLQVKYHYVLPNHTPLPYLSRGEHNILDEEDEEGLTFPDITEMYMYTGDPQVGDPQVELADTPYAENISQYQVDKHTAGNDESDEDTLVNAVDEAPLRDDESEDPWIYGWSPELEAECALIRRQLETGDNEVNYDLGEAFVMPNEEPNYFRARNGTYKRVPQFVSEGLRADGGITVYYIPSPNANEKVTAFKPGFRMLVGDAAARTPGPARKVCHRCMPKTGDNSNINCGAPDSQFLPKGPCEGGIRSVITFPTCWDGKNTDSIDHMSHVAYPNSSYNDVMVGAYGTCPASHPVKIPQVMYEVMWNTQMFNDKELWPEDGSQPFVWSSGDPIGVSQHGDYVFGWQGDSLQRAMDARCNGAVCGQLETQSSESAMKCTKSRTVQEDIDGWLTDIPGMAMNE
ncbi:hypothetical protein GQX73_g1735 [Xylaria multiplex]|uniref:DUF1996 domain-containing protein n=1 Tax=Xylaria multiplex TaxID=323545 RepID=A0A7C8ITD9_9PEZI|nr:hypothetical protein GQX73_g1735 [Xylaria multiplex]